MTVRRDRPMRFHLENLRDQLGYIHVNDEEPRLWGCLTPDFAGLLLKDLLREDYKRIDGNAHGDVNVCLSIGNFTDTTIVTNRFREVGDSVWGGSDLGAGVQYILQGVPLASKAQIDDLRVRRVRVHTPVAGRAGVGLTTSSGERFANAASQLFRGGELCVKLGDAPLEHNGWTNSISLTASTGVKNAGIVYDDLMHTTIPLDVAAGHDAIVTALETVRAYMVLLTLLNGCHPVDLHTVEVDCDGLGWCLILFHWNAPDVVRYGLKPPNARYSYHRNLLRSWTGLDEIGMAGVARWVDWWQDRKNRYFREHWLRSDDEARPLLALEALARANAWRTGKLYAYAKTVKRAMAELHLTYLFADNEEMNAVASALAHANNHSKHVGQWNDEALYESTHRLAEVAEVWMSYVVGYGAIVAADVGDDVAHNTDGMRAKWVSLIETAYEQHVKPAIADVATAAM